jgi:hypothetical protein
MLLSGQASADCGNQRLVYMAQNDLESAQDLIACLEHEVAKASQSSPTSAAVVAGKNDCPAFPIIPVSPKTPGNPVGSEQEIYAFLRYYHELTGLDSASWMTGAASALDDNDATALVAGNSKDQFCSTTLPVYDFDWSTGSYSQSDNGLGIILFPEVDKAFGGN